MRALVLLTLLLAVPILAVETPLGSRAQPPPPPIYVVLWFDTEDYILPESDDAAKRVAEMLTRLSVRATFKVVGEKARVLEQRGRKDVISALGRHEIGYHSNTHSQQPTIAVYLQHAGWEGGSAEFLRREGPGVKDIERIFGVTPTCYGQPGAAWAPQAYSALKQLGIGMYLDEGSHVGLNDQPFYYCGMLNVFRMNSMTARMDLSGEDSQAQGKARFRKAYDTLRGRGGGTVSIYYHPCEFIHREFWDGVNFADGKNPPRGEWRRPRMKSATEIETAFSNFQHYVEFIKSLPGVRFVTASELMEFYADPTPSRSFSRAEILSLARSVRKEISFQQLDRMSLSGADIFSLLTEAFSFYLERKEMPSATKLRQLYGPTLPFTPSSGRERPATFTWPAFTEAVRDVASYCRRSGHIPSEVWLGADSISPQDYLATLAALVDESVAWERLPDQVTVREGRLTAETYIAKDSLRLWDWVIFPKGFRAPKIMELAKLQAWTLKPALLQH